MPTCRIVNVVIRYNISDGDRGFQTDVCAPGLRQLCRHRRRATSGGVPTDQTISVSSSERDAEIHQITESGNGNPQL